MVPFQEGVNLVVFLTISNHLKYGLIREVTHDGSGLIKEAQYYHMSASFWPNPYKNKSLYSITSHDGLWCL